MRPTERHMTLLRGMSGTPADPDYRYSLCKTGRGSREDGQMGRWEGADGSSMTHTLPMKLLCFCRHCPGKPLVRPAATTVNRTKGAAAIV